jgi:MYXO-CTERM domain-containing protein
VNKLITSLACCTVLSMSVMGASYASHAIGSAALGGVPAANTGMDGNANHTRMINTNSNLMNGTTGTVNQHENLIKDKIRPDDHYRPSNYNSNSYDQGNYNNDGRVAPLSNTTPTGKYRATSTTTNTAGTTSRGSNWGWLGLFGLLGLVGMRSRSDERR